MASLVARPLLASAMRDRSGKNGVVLRQSALSHFLAKADCRATLGRRSSKDHHLQEVHSQKIF